jgi:uncharacterized membrane protein YeiH
MAAEQLFTLPIYFDYGATFVWSVSGALIAARRGYDAIGVSALALVSATGGGLLRDGLFLQNGPPALVRTPFYLFIVAVATVLVLVSGARLKNQERHISPVVHIVDALGLGAYAVVGMQLSTQAGLSVPAVTLVGVVNAVGGSILRDVLVRQEPEIFRPGTLTALAALTSCLVFLALVAGIGLSPSLAAWPAILMAALVRTVSVRYDLRTRPVFGPQELD